MEVGTVDKPPDAKFRKLSWDGAICMSCLYIRYVFFLYFIYMLFGPLLTIFTKSCLIMFTDWIFFRNSWIFCFCEPKLVVCFQRPGIYPLTLCIFNKSYQSLARYCINSLRFFVVLVFIRTPDETYKPPHNTPPPLLYQTTFPSIKSPRLCPRLEQRATRVGI